MRHPLLIMNRQAFLRGTVFGAGFATAICVSAVVGGLLIPRAFSVIDLNIELASLNHFYGPPESWGPLAQLHRCPREVFFVDVTGDGKNECFVLFPHTGDTKATMKALTTGKVRGRGFALFQRTSHKWLCAASHMTGYGGSFGLRPGCQPAVFFEGLEGSRDLHRAEWAWKEGRTEAPYGRGWSSTVYRWRGDAVDGEKDKNLAVEVRSRPQWSACWGK